MSSNPNTNLSEDVVAAIASALGLQHSLFVLKLNAGLDGESISIKGDFRAQMLGTEPMIIVTLPERRVAKIGGSDVNLTVAKFCENGATVDPIFAEFITAARWYIDVQKAADNYGHPAQSQDGEPHPHGCLLAYTALIAMDVEQKSRAEASEAIMMDVEKRRQSGATPSSVVEDCVRRLLAHTDPRMVHMLTNMNHGALVAEKASIDSQKASNKRNKKAI